MDFIKVLIEPTETTKKSNGEVLTPFELINEMLDLLPEEVWVDPNLKWLDPASGLGNFQFVVFKRLMERLVSIPLKVREEHILIKMIYYAEWSSLNTNIYRKLIDKNNKYGDRLNIHQGDSLELNIFKKHWDIEKFDIIIGNPPFNNTIWKKFVNISFDEILKKNGYLSFIHPPSWRKQTTKTSRTYGLFKKMVKDNTMLGLKMYSLKEGLKLFNAGTRFDYYLIQKIKNNDVKTKIINYNKEISFLNLNEYNFLPHFNMENIFNLIDIKLNEYIDVTKIISNNINNVSQSHVSEKKNEEFKYHLVHSTNKNGVRYYYSNTKDLGHFGTSKAIFGESGINDVILDNKGEYGMTTGAMAIPYKTEEEGKRIKKILLHKKFKDNITNPQLFGTFRIDWRMFLSFKKDWWKILEKEYNLNEDNNKE